MTVASKTSRSTQFEMSASSCKHALRRLELDAYCSVVSALRAQGDLSNDKRRLLKDLQGSLRIPLERHRAEVRRAVNDDRLKAIADMVSDEVNVSAGWQLEGRRLIPVLPRLMAQSCNPSSAYFTAKSSDPVKMQIQFDERYDKKPYNCRGSGSPARKRGKVYDEIFYKESVYTNALSEESLPLEASLRDVNHDDLQLMNLASESYESSSEQKHQSLMALSSNQRNTSKLIPLSVESTELSINQNSGSNNMFDTWSAVHHASQAVQLTQVINQQPQVSQPTMSAVFQQAVGTSQQLPHNIVASTAVASQNIAPHVNQIPCSHQMPAVSTTMPVLMSRSASASTTRLASNHMKSGPTPKVIIVSGTGMSTATTISGPPPPATVSSAVSFTPKQSPNKINVNSIQKTAGEIPVSLALTPSVVGTGSTQNVVSPVCSASIPLAVNTVHSVARMFSPRGVPIIRPRLSTLTARIRTSQPPSSINSAVPSIVSMATTSFVTAGIQNTRNLQKILSSSASAVSNNQLTSQSLNIQLKNVKLMTPTVQMRQDSDKKILTQTFQAMTGSSTAVKTTQSVQTTVVPTVFVKATQTLLGATTTSPLAKLSQTSQATTMTHTAVSRVTQALQVITAASMAKGTQPLQVLATGALPPATVVVAPVCQTSTTTVPRIIPKSAPQISTAYLASTSKSVTIQSKVPGSLVSTSNSARLTNVVTVVPSKPGVTTSGGRIILSDSGGVRRNVIVVQKPLSSDRAGSSMDLNVSTSKPASPFEKELVSFIQRQDMQQTQPSALQSIKTSAVAATKPIITSASMMSSYVARDECELDYTTAPFVDCPSDSYDSVLEFRTSKHSADISTDSADSDELGHASDNGDMSTAVNDADALVTENWSTSRRDESVSSHSLLPVFVEQSLIEDTASRDMLPFTSAECINDNTLILTGKREFMSLASCQTGVEPISEAANCFNVVFQPFLVNLENVSISDKSMSECEGTLNSSYLSSSETTGFAVSEPSDNVNDNPSVPTDTAATISNIYLPLSRTNEPSLEAGTVVDDVYSNDHLSFKLQPPSETTGYVSDILLPVSDTNDCLSLKFDNSTEHTVIVTNVNLPVSNSSDSLICTLQPLIKVNSTVSIVDHIVPNTDSTDLLQSLSEACDTVVDVKQPSFESDDIVGISPLSVVEGIDAVNESHKNMSANKELNVDQLPQKKEANLTDSSVTDTLCDAMPCHVFHNTVLSQNVESVPEITVFDSVPPAIDIITTDSNALNTENQVVRTEQVFVSATLLTDKVVLSDSEVVLHTVHSISSSVKTRESDVNSSACDTTIFESKCKELDLLLDNQSDKTEELISDETINHATPSCESASGSDDILHSPSSNLGKRKRKPSSLLDELESPTSVTGWSRQALMLLGRVMRFRNVNGDKSRCNPAAWFNQPVDADEVPDYYDIVKHPMDFSSIKKKLETGIYSDWSHFHTDMLLVKENCHLYNATGTQVRHDCDLVFSFYEQEISKTANKLPMQGGHSSDKKKKLD